MHKHHDDVQVYLHGGYHIVVDAELAVMPADYHLDIEDQVEAEDDDRDARDDYP